MKNLSLKYKFIIIILLAALPATIATYLLARAATVSIEFTSDQLAGRDYLQPLSRVYKYAGEHRVAYMSSLVDNAAELVIVRDALTQSLNEVDSLNAQYGESLRLGDTWSIARSSLEQLMRIETGLDYDKASQVHDASIEHLDTLARLVGDHSNLVLDPGLGSFYLIDAILLKINPALSALDHYQVKFTEKSGFMYQLPNQYTLQKVQAEIDKVVSTIKTAMRHDTKLSALLSDTTDQFVLDTSDAMARLEKVRVNSTPQLQQAAFVATSTALDSGYTLFDDINIQIERLLSKRMANDTRSRNITLACVLAAIICCMLFSFYVGRNIVKTVFRAKTVAEAIADDRLDNDIQYDGRDEPAQLMAALSLMQEKLNDRITRDYQQAVVNGRIKQALECVSSPVLMADTDEKIIYANRSADEFFNTYKVSLARDISGFSPDNIIGQPINFLCADQKLDTSGTHDNASAILNCLVGDRYLRFIPSHVQDDDGASLGTVVEIRDRSDPVAIEQALNNDVLGLVEDALAGNLSGQINAHGKPEFLVPVYSGINDMVGVCNNVISSAGELFKLLAAGDLSRSWRDDESLTLKGDFLKLRDNANATVVQLADMISRLKGDASIVSASASNVIGVNTKLEDNSLNTSQQANSVSTAVHSISDNVDTIAGAAEQMNASIKEILKNTHRSTVVADEAVDLTRAADERVAQLSSSSLDIGAMVKVINSIAEQTNLLALNATIEAARAGDAGKGFAVVANEVKELAKETAKATEDISSKIRAIQQDSSKAADGIREIDTIVQQISDLQTDSASAMEQQSTTTQEISRSIGTVANSTSEILLEVGELVKGTGDTSEAVQGAKVEVMQLNTVAGNLQKLVDHFKLGDDTHPTTIDNKAA